MKATKWEQSFYNGTLTVSELLFFLFPIKVTLWNNNLFHKSYPVFLHILKSKNSDVLLSVVNLLVDLSVFLYLVKLTGFLHLKEKVLAGEAFVNGGRRRKEGKTGGVFPHGAL